MPQPLEKSASLRSLIHQVAGAPRRAAEKIVGNAVGPKVVEHLSSPVFIKQVVDEMKGQAKQYAKTKAKKIAPYALGVGGLAAGAAAIHHHTHKQEKPVKNKYAGVTLDSYDDNGDTLKAMFPTVDQLPSIIKTANVHDKDDLSNEDFALVMVDEGWVHRKYACHDPGTTAMSVIYFMEHGDKLPEQAQKTAAVNLVAACQSFDIEPPPALVKTALLGIHPTLNYGEATRRFNASPIGQAMDAEHAPAMLAKKQPAPALKVASTVDVTGRRPKPIVKVAKPMSDNDYAVVLEDGRKLYPINSWDLVKKAEDYFQQEGSRMNPEIRRQYSVKLAAKAQSMGYPLDEKIKEAGAVTLAPFAQRKMAIEMRKVACAPGQDRQFLDDFVKIGSQVDPTAYAETLKRFDIQHGLEHGWNQLYPDPWASTFAINKVAEVYWEEGPDRMTREALINLAENHTSGIQELFSHDFLKEFIKDPEGQFDALPLNMKRVLARLADSMAHGGGSEGSGTKNESMRL